MAGQQLRLTNEQQLRLQWLAQSLRQTEPDAQRRTQLDTIYKLAAGDERFVFDRANAQSAWRCLRLSRHKCVGWVCTLVSGSGYGRLAALSAAGAAQALWAWALLLALCLAAVLWAALRLPRAPWLAAQAKLFRGGSAHSPVGALLLGPTLVLLLLLTFAPQRLDGAARASPGVSAGVLWALLVGSCGLNTVGSRRDAVGVLVAMPLRTRLTLLMVLLGTVLCACFAIVLWLHNQTLSQRYHDELLRTQSVAWQSSKAEATLELRDAAAACWCNPSGSGRGAGAISAAMRGAGAAFAACPSTLAGGRF